MAQEYYVKNTFIMGVRMINRYEAEHALIEELLNGRDLQRLFDVAEDVLGNPITFIDAAWNEPYKSKGYPIDDIEDRKYRKINISDEENQKDIQYINSLSMTGRPHILGWAYIRRKRLCLSSEN